MKKKKPTEPMSKDFKNNPFKSLKGFSPPPTPVINKPVPISKQKDTNPEDDSTLFLKSVEGVKRIGGSSGAKAAPRKPAPENMRADASPEDQQLFFETMKKIGTTLKDHHSGKEDEETGRRSPSNRMRQLKRGTLRINQELDLHGLLLDEALKRLEHFLVTAFSLGHRAVLVITGKGINSPDGPVLQGAVDAWLRGRGKGMVAEFFPAPHTMGGSGAYVVFLKKNTSTSDTSGN
jgi:DNA-nicking Smr family endonuclease